MCYKKVLLSILIVNFCFAPAFNSNTFTPDEKKGNRVYSNENILSHNLQKLTRNDFRVTHQKYLCTTDLVAAVNNEYGNEWTVADWEHVKLLNSNDYRGIKMHKGDEYLILRNGQKYYSGNRHYFIAKHQGDIPGGFFVHDQIGNNYFSLGSWHDITMRILCVKKSAVE